MEEYPPGFRFYPTEEELISFYLHHKLQETSQTHISRVIPVIDIYDEEPWNLPRFSGELCQGDTEQWFFFVPRQEREAQGGRPNRTTASGYWKATGSPNYVYSCTNKVIGVKKTMVFYKGKAPLGQKTKWKMNEYRAIEEEVLTSSISSSTNSYAAPRLRHEMSVCRIYVVSGSSRVFDRRPLGTVITQETIDKPQIQKNENAENKPKIEITSSNEGSYLGGNHLLQVVDVMEFEGTASNSQMINAQECLFETLGWH